MNERMRELMIQSMIETGRYQDVQKTYERFGELIVKECYQHCKDQLMGKKLADDAGLDYNDGVMDCAIGLKLYFGEVTEK